MVFFGVGTGKVLIPYVQYHKTLCNVKYIRKVAQRDATCCHYSGRSFSAFKPTTRISINLQSHNIINLILERMICDNGIS
ncbi:hypothetical protein I7I50_03110 [Histoplasma capsulatum G186AR]|uniref:Uncharacterized protein n=1 Tax=Ajellomyces capsulatus TaxID=5037 RepID=A0A8H7Z1R4_AJECA|nr:hypothetical protein I7I52_00224 [Histoplasma capsulatum]QSS72056.1 hypothetical protein I7I50_03110 [Histoplasma capsulatum G186AR]